MISIRLMTPINAGAGTMRGGRGVGAWPWHNSKRLGTTGSSMGSRCLSALQRTQGERAGHSAALELQGASSRIRCRETSCRTLT